MEEYREALIRKLKVLNETVWEGRADAPRVNMWLENFEEVSVVTQDERLHALYLLRHFMYFGERQIRELLKSLYRDLYKYPIVAQIRKQNGNTIDALFILREFDKEMRKTRFLGMGNPSESGPHLLYPFRQENAIPPQLFIDASQISNLKESNVKNADIIRYVFIDDICGSGVQAKAYSESLLGELKHLNPNVHISYYLLFATSNGLKELRESQLFDEVECVYELDETFKCFSSPSRYFTPEHSEIDPTFAEAMCRKYGQRLNPQDPLGGGDGQLLLGLHHNTPDNSLPIFWCGEPTASAWVPIFRRYSKY